MAEGDERPGGRAPLAARRHDVVLDVLVGLAVVALLVLPLAAVHSVRDDPTPPGAVAIPAITREPAGPPLRDLPILESGGEAATAVAAGAMAGDAATRRATIERAATSALGPAGAAALLERYDDVVPLSLDLTTGLAVSGGSGNGPPPVAYPYRFPRTAGVLAAATGADPGALQDLGGLLLLAAAADPYQHGNAAALAFVVLDQARRDGDCERQLDLALTLAIEAPIQVDHATKELAVAAELCPDDPTPTWLLGQLQSGQGDVHPNAFRTLRSRWPGSPLGWAGEGDGLLRQAYRVQLLQPFTARALLRQADALYARATALSDDPGVLAGRARAAAALGDAEGAVRFAEEARVRAPGSLPLQVQHIDALEAAHRFEDAATTARGDLARPAPVPVWLAALTPAMQDDGVAIAGGRGPVSIGTDRARGVGFPISQSALAYTDGVTDLSFLPTYRAHLAITGPGGVCRDRALVRDLVLAGRPAQALAALPGQFSSVGDPTPGYCDDGGLLRSVILRELGRVDEAIATLPGYVLPFGTTDTAAYLAEVDQDLWRYAGDYDRAAASVAAWIERAPDDPVPRDRAGEIEHLRGDEHAAATRFAEAATRSTGPAVAHELLKQGTALELAGDLAAARRLLDNADEVASPAVPTALAPNAALTEEEAGTVFDSYNIRLQAGDAALRAHDDEAAVVHYEAARKVATLLPASGYSPDMTERREPVRRPEVLENNEAIVLLHLGRQSEAEAAIDAAVAVDPGNPVFLGNQGYIRQVGGDLEGAAASYRAALAADETTFPAANNLGVILAEQGHLGSATAAFRRSLAVEPDYARARFNLGLVLARRGPTHLLEAQGQLAKAIRDDHSLRNQDHELIVDDDTFFTTLDLSKPVPADWHFAESEQRTPITVAGVVLALLVLGVVRTLAQGWATDNATAKSLQGSSKRLGERLAVIARRLPAAIAVAFVVGVVLYPLLRSAGTTRDELVLMVVGVSILTVAFMRARARTARRHGVEVAHRPHLPAVLVGGAAAAVGVGFAPMPATISDEPLPDRARWHGTGTLAAVSLGLLLLGRLTLVPAATQLGALGLLMTASALIPVDPHDGAHLPEGKVALAVAIALGATGILLQLGVL